VHHHHHSYDTRSDLTARAAVHITLLGEFGVRVDGVLTPGPGWARKGAANLVKVLALARGHQLHREQALDLLWPDESPYESSPRLHKAAHFARRAAGRHDTVVVRGDVVRLFPDAQLTVDVDCFEELARRAVSAEDAGTAREALGWYGGELLPADRYDDWAADRRELLHLRHLDVLRVAGEWRELTELDPTNEEAHTHLMRRHLDAGNGAAAVRQYDHLERVLQRELGVQPGDRARATAREAVRPLRRPTRAGALLAELAQLIDRRGAVLAELATMGVIGVGADGALPLAPTHSDAA